ncbi:MAG: DNA-deoxyinosine glycosylase [Coriobacteriales bacterium]|nr:DNA-deoxyinosine glycosylase [Coriobacteriales bacterium]
MEHERIAHPWPPFYDDDSKVLILGTIPSPASRKMGFFYGHPQNVFWSILAEVLEQPEPPRDIEARKTFLLKSRIALWDVLRAATISGAADMSIREPEPNLFSPLLVASNIHTVFTTGRQATHLFNELCATEAGTQAIYLPSTSPANRAAQAKPEFKTQWRQVAAALR